MDRAWAGIDSDIRGTPMRNDQIARFYSYVGELARGPPPWIRPLVMMMGPGVWGRRPRAWDLARRLTPLDKSIVCKRAVRGICACHNITIKRNLIMWAFYIMGSGAASVRVNQLVPPIAVAHSRRCRGVSHIVFN